MLILLFSTIPFMGSTKTTFWVLLVTFIGTILLFRDEEARPITKIVSNLIALGCIQYYFSLKGEKTWFLNSDVVSGFTVFVGWFLSLAFIMFLFCFAWGLIKNIFAIFDNPIFAIIAFILGILWGVTAIKCFWIYFAESPILSLFTIMGSVAGGTHTPTIYVEGEGHITGKGEYGGDRFHGDNGETYTYNGNRWKRE